MSDVTALYNTEAERSLIGAVITDNRLLKAFTDLKADDFYDSRHRVLFACICDLAAKGNVDLVTINDWLGKHRAEKDAGGILYVSDCVTGGFLTSMAGHYIKIVKECSMRRKLTAIGQELANRAAGSDDPEDTRDWAARTIKDIRFGDMAQLIPIEEACVTTYREIERLQERPDEPSKKILSGIATLDNKLGGLMGGEYVAIGARPSVGKSILALTFCVNAAKQGKKVLLISLEMNETQIVERVLAAEGETPLHVITSGNIPDEGWRGIARAVGPVSGLPIWFSLEATTVDKVRRAAYRLYENGGLDMIAVDYLQLMESTYAKRQSRQEQISEISRGLRQLAAELKIPILVLTQLNRSSVNERVDGKKVKREPTMNEARESGAIEQDANIFILLHNPGRDEMNTDRDREEWDRLDKQGMTMMRLIIDKNRQGKHGRVTVAFDGDHMKFLPIVRKD